MPPGRPEQGLSPSEVVRPADLLFPLYPMIPLSGHFHQDPLGASSEGGGGVLEVKLPQKPTPPSVWSSEPLKSSLPSASPTACKMS